MPEHIATIDGPGQSVAAAPGVRVAYWHPTYREQNDPQPGTILRVGRKFLTVDFDGQGQRRITAQNLTPWSEPRDA